MHIYYYYFFLTSGNIAFKKNHIILLCFVFLDGAYWLSGSEPRIECPRLWAQYPISGLIFSTGVWLGGCKVIHHW